MAVILTGCYVGTRKGRAGFSYWGDLEQPDVFVNRSEKCNPRLRKGVKYDVAANVRKDGVLIMEGVKTHG